MSAKESANDDPTDDAKESGSPDAQSRHAKRLVAVVLEAPFETVLLLPLPAPGWHAASPPHSGPTPKSGIPQSC